MVAAILVSEHFLIELIRDEGMTVILVISRRFPLILSVLSDIPHEDECGI
jgi:hypothetical protein